jgi:hypothetical protein
MRTGIEEVSEIIWPFSPFCADEKTPSFSIPRDRQLYVSLKFATPFDHYTCPNQSLSSRGASGKAISLEEGQTAGHFEMASLSN